MENQTVQSPVVVQPQQTVKTFSQGEKMKTVKAPKVKTTKAPHSFYESCHVDCCEIADQIRRKTTIKGLSAVVILINSNTNLSATEKSYMLKEVNKKEKQILSFVSLITEEPKVAVLHDDKYKAVVKKCPKIAPETKAERKIKAKALEAKAKVKAKANKDANNAKFGANAADFFAGAEVSKAMVEWLNSFSSADVSKQSKNQQQKAEKPKFKAVSVVKEAKTKRLKWSRIVEEAQRFVRAWNFNFLNLNKLVTLFYLQQRCKDAGIVTSIPSFIEDSGNFAASLLSMIQGLETDNLIGLKSLVEAALTEQGESQEDAETKANDLLYYLLHDGVLLNRDLSPVREMRSGSSAGANQTQQPQKQKQQQSEKDKNMKAESYAQASTKADKWNFLKSLNLTKDVNYKKTTLSQLDDIYRDYEKSLVQKQKENQLYNQSYKRTDDSAGFTKVSATNSLNIKAQLQGLVFGRKLYLKEQYLMTPSFVFIRNNSAGNLAASLLSNDNDASELLDQKEDESLSLIMDVSGDYAATIYKFMAKNGITAAADDIIKVTAPQMASSNEKKQIALLMADLGYAPWNDGFYLKRGSDVAKALGSFAIGLFGTGDDALLGVRSYFRSLVSTPALKELNVPVVIVSKDDAYLDGNKTAKGTDGGAICTYHLVNGRQSFQFRSFSWLNQNDGLFAKGYCTQAKVVWCKEDQKLVDIDSVKFNVRGEFIQEINGKTYIAGIFLNKSMFKGAHKSAIKVGQILDANRTMTTVIAEDNNLPAKMLWGWQNNNNLPMTDTVTKALYAAYADIMGKYVRKGDDLYNYTRMNAGVISTLNANGNIRLQTAYVQTANLGGNEDLKSGKEGLVFALLPNGKNGKPLSASKIVMGRSPQQSWACHASVMAYSPSFAISLFDKMIENNFNYNNAKSHEVDFLTTINKRYSWWSVDKDGKVDFNNVISTHFAKELSDYRWFLKFVIAPSVMQGTIWADYSLQAIINGDNDGDKNWYSFDAKIIAIVDGMMDPQGNGGMPKKVIESSKKLLAKSARMSIAEFKAYMDDPAIEMTQEVKDALVYLTASGGSPGQGNVGAVTNMVGAFSAFIPFFKDGKWVATSEMVQVIEYIYQVQQIAIDWQKYYYFAVSLNQWHLWNTSINKAIPGYTYLVPGQTEFISDDIVAKYKLNSTDPNEVVDYAGYCEYANANFGPTTWKEFLFDTNGNKVEITDRDVMYSTIGVYTWGMWLVNAFKIAAASNGQLTGKDVWTMLLENDQASMAKIAECFKLAKDEQAAAIANAVKSIFGVDNHKWIKSNELTAWTKRNTSWSDNQEIAVPVQIRNMQQQIRAAYQYVCEKQGIVQNGDDARSSILDNFIESYKDLLNKPTISYKAGNKVLSMPQSKQTYFFMRVMGNYAAAQAQSLEGLAQSVIAQGSNSESPSQALRLLINALSMPIYDDAEEGRINIDSVRSQLEAALPLDSAYTKEFKTELLGKFKEAAIQDLVLIAQAYEKDMPALKITIAEGETLKASNNPKFNKNTHNHNLEKLKKLEDSYENKIELQQWLCNAFLPALEQSLENLSAGTAVAQYSNDKIVTVLKDCLAKKFSAEDTISALKTKETTAREELADRSAGFEEISEAYLLDVSDLKAKLAEGKLDQSKYDSAMAKLESKFELDKVRTKEYQDAMHALNYYQKVYRAIAFYGDVKKAFESIVEKKSVFNQDGKRTSIERLRSKILFEMSHDMKVSFFETMIKNGINITVLSRRIENISADAKQFDSMKEAVAELADAAFVFKPAYIYIAGQELNAYLVDDEIKTACEVFASTGLGTVFTGQDLENVKFFMDNVNPAASKVLDKIANYSKKLVVNGQFTEEVDGNKDFKETYCLPFGYLVRNSWFNKNQFQPKRYVSIAAETALGITSNWNSRSDEEKAKLTSFYKDTFLINDPYANTGSHKAKNATGAVSVAKQASNVFEVSGKVESKKQEIDLAVDTDFNSHSTILTGVNGSAVSLKDIAYNYATKGGTNVDVLLKLAGLESLIDNRLVKLHAKAEKDMDKNLFKSALNRLNIASVRQVFKNADILFEGATKDDRFLKLTSIEVDNELKAVTDNDNAREFMLTLVDIIFGADIQA